MSVQRWFEINKSVTIQKSKIYIFRKSFRTKIFIRFEEVQVLCFLSTQFFVPCFYSVLLDRASYN
jgi:hypothetical protein